MDGPFVYLKDAWRVDHEGIEQEGKILAVLNDDSGGGPVNGVPTLRCHGDVEDQVTRSQIVWQRKHPGIDPKDCPLKTHRHYRLVVDEVCRPMREFDTFLDLVVMIHDCIAAHGDAYVRKGLLHRDISAGNVLIYPKQVVTDSGVTEDPVGILADWELASKVKESKTKQAPPQSHRAGTWQFTSAMALDNPEKRVVVQDDMESFFHLILYYAIRFLPNNCGNVDKFMDGYFDGQLEVDGEYYGGEEKLHAMREGKMTVFGADALKFYTSEEQTQPSADNTSQQYEEALDSSISSGALEIESAAASQEAGGSSELHPINSLFSDFLTRIKAHYALYYTPRKTIQKKPTQDDRRTRFSKPPTFTERRMRLRIRFAGDSDEESDSDEAPSSETPEVVLPTQQRKLFEEAAAKLGDHKEMKKLFSRHIRKHAWPDEDRVADQLPKKHSRNTENTSTKNTKTTKRTHDMAQLDTAERQSKRTRSMR
ncbi:hypothetical protein NUW54_g5771 [Trametes sanguinea]|uniref:Uncharacterized protein n=1 Tax=Trametes sanguinea TaxID=158606 RepID=A0ACC1PW07_9APHY|nr:hypothetical protein NUW54_g5771 [Trametes sanguinea]